MLSDSGVKSLFYYAPSIAFDGEEAKEMIKRINEKSYALVKDKCAAGATLQALEDKDLLDEYLDWSMCLSVVGRSPDVFKKIVTFQEEAAKKREEYMSERINETLGENEAGILFMTNETRMRIQPKLSSDIKVFLVHPPALNDIQQWLREYMSKRMMQNS